MGCNKGVCTPLEFEAKMLMQLKEVVSVKNNWLMSVKISKF
jgi:hypothetical protein